MSVSCRSATPWCSRSTKPIDALAGGVVAARAGSVRIDVGMGDDRHGLVDVVEDDHAIVEGEAEVRQTAIVRRRVRQAFDVAHGVVGGIADGAAAEARQARQGRRAIGGQAFLQQPQRIGMLQLDGAWRFGLLPGRIVDPHARAVTPGTQKRAGADEAVATQTLAADDALEEKRPIALLDFAEGA